MARIPSNCFFARIAAATVSKAIMAEPLDRPLRSYYGSFGGVQEKKRVKPKKLVSACRDRRGREQVARLALVFSQGKLGGVSYPK